MIPFHDILKELEYDTSPYYYTEEHSFAPETVPMFRAARSAGVRGIYGFKTSPDSEPKVLHPRPVVYVAEAKHETEARAIHCKLWNLYYVPFLIINLPNQIRVDGVYAARYDEAIMLGYVQSDSLEYWQREVMRSIDTHKGILCLISPQKENLVIAYFPLEWMSTHNRERVGHTISILHILLDFRTVDDAV